MTGSTENSKSDGTGENDLSTNNKIDYWEPEPQVDDAIQSKDKADSVDPSFVELKSEADQISTDDPDTSGSDPQHHLEMRQIAGLAAGTTMKLPEGVFSFREGDKDVAFSISVKNAIPTVVPGKSEIRIDNKLVGKPTPLSGNILNVNSARFSISTPRSDYGEYSKPITAASHTTIEVPKFSNSPKSDWFANNDPETATTDLDAEEWEFIEKIRAAKDEDSRIQRLLHPNPEEISFRSKSGGFALFERGANDPFFTRFSIAYGSIPWTPKLRTNSIPTRLHGNIDQLCTLNSVPITSNTKNGPLAIVGPRPARLSVARHAILSLVGLNKPGSVELKILTTDKNHNSSWLWLSKLPEWISSPENDFRVVVSDGMRSFELSGLDQSLAEDREIGLIVLADSLAEVPSFCSVVLQVSDKGICRATNQSGDSLEGTAIGVTEEFAIATANALKSLHPKL